MLPKKKKILVIDDDDALRNIVRDALSGAGFSVRTANNGEEGLKVALEEEPDLILLDIIMPKLDGMGMLEKLRRNNWGKYAKVILLTNLDETERVAQAAERGTFDYLIKKDYKIKELVTKVKEKLHIEID